MLLVSFFGNSCWGGVFSSVQKGASAQTHTPTTPDGATHMSRCSVTDGGDDYALWPRAETVSCDRTIHDSTLHLEHCFATPRTGCGARPPWRCFEGMQGSETSTMDTECSVSADWDSTHTHSCTTRATAQTALLWRTCTCQIKTESAVRAYATAQDTGPGTRTEHMSAVNTCPYVRDV
jgi:hypothetical protein